MKNTFIALSLIVVTGFVLALSLATLPTPSYATVGGPTTISDFKYNRDDESIYYILTSSSGKGCPPELHKIDLISEQNEEIYSCDMGFAFGAQSQNLSVYSEFAIITEGFKTLSPINLAKNNIAIDVKYVSEGESNPVGMSKNINVFVYQNGTQIDNFAATTCSLEQPFMFQGYEIPGFNKKIALLFSAKRNCFEGGYIDESLHIINNISSLDRVSGRTNLYKSYLPLVPDESTLIVFEQQTVAVGSGAAGGVASGSTGSGAGASAGGNTSAGAGNTNTPDTNENTDAENNEEPAGDSSTTILLTILSVLIALIAGLLIGKTIYKKV